MSIVSSLALLLFGLPAHAAEPAVFDVAGYGAVGDGTTVNTDAIQKTIDACTAHDGGGIVQIGPGRFVSGTIQLKSNVTLRLDAAAVLLGSTNAADYRNLDPFTAGDGIPLGHALIVAMDATHVGLEGAGAIDGQGIALKAAQKPYVVRPFLVRFLRCSDVAVRDLHLGSPGAWTLNFFQTQNATVERVTIRSRGLVNNDGIDLDSCEQVRISDCDIDSSDDALCLKATSAKPCRDITASGCKLSTTCNGIKLGTESLGDFENIQVSNCQLHDIGMAGIAVYCVDGGHTSNIAVKDIQMDGVTVPVSIRLGARLKTFRAGDVAKSPGVIRDVHIENVTATRVKQIGLLINGIPDHPVENLGLSNIRIQLPGGGKAADANVQFPEKINAYPEMSMFGKTMPSYGMYLRHVRGITFKDLSLSTIQPDARPERALIDVQGISPEMPATNP